MVFVIATAGLVYELGMAAVASYVIGDSVAQFSIVIGLYLSALGLGSYLSRFIDSQLGLRFIDIELATALLGGLSAPGLFIAFGFGVSFETLLFVVVVAVGTLVGIELPLLMRILETRLTFKELVARALTYDYAGALLGSLGFSLLLVPHLGLSRSSVLCGLLNAVVGLISTWLLCPRDLVLRKPFVRARGRALVVIVLLLCGFYWAPRLVDQSESHQKGQVVRAISSHYQRVLLTLRDGNLELHLNGHLQFSSSDEARYHEALVHPVLASTRKPRRVLVGGGGDGLAVRELLKWPTIEEIVLVDLDPAMTDLARTEPLLTALNHDSLSDRRVRVVNEDAFRYVQHDSTRYDAILLDFPDPTSYAVGKLYTTTFYARIRDRLTDAGALGVQSTSPRLTRASFSTINATLESVGFAVQPYRVFVPSFGDWGFVLAHRHPTELPRHIPIYPLSTLDDTLLLALFQLPDDSSTVRAPINRLDNQSLVLTYLEEAARTE
jgi:spermidine synthase